ALVDSRPEPLRDHAAADLVHELVVSVRDRRHDDVAVAELAAPAGLLLVAAVGTRLAPDRLAVRHARLMELDVHSEPSLRALESNLDVHLAHPREDLLARLLVAVQVKRRVLFGEPANRGRHLLLVALRLGGDGEAHHGLGEAELRSLDGDLLVREQIPGLRLLELRDSS